MANNQFTQNRMETIMLTTDMTHTKTLQEFYDDLRKRQEEYHGEDYCAVHDEIVRLMEKCETYKELGVKQGTTLAAVLLQKPKSVIGIDRSLKDYSPCKALFEKYATDNDIDFKVIEDDSCSFRATATDCDLLFIDTWHVYSQLKKELNAHYSFVNKYIVMHDTHSKPELGKAIEEFLNSGKKWRLYKVNNKNVGYTVLEKE